MFEQTKVLCEHFLKRGIPGFDDTLNLEYDKTMLVLKGSQCMF